MRIYSDKWENVVLWDGDLPGGAVALDAAATEANLEERYEQLIEDYCKKYGVNEDAEKWTDYDATMADHAQQDAWEALWTPGNADDCYVWIKNTPSTMGRKGGKSKSAAKTAAARENAKKGGRPPLCAECKERCEPGLSPVWMKYRKRDGLWHAIEVPLCIDHRHVGTVRYKGRYCTSAN